MAWRDVARAACAPRFLGSIARPCLSLASAAPSRLAVRSMASAVESPWPIFTKVSDFKGWRRQTQRDAILSRRDEEYQESVGFVPTMGALHQGHLDLVQNSLLENRHTVVSIFVNPAQFAPTEDLQSYPRTLEADIAALRELEAVVSRQSAGQRVGNIAAILCPTVKEMYPSLPGTDVPFTQDVSQQQGAFVEVKGLGDVLEGKSRPTFFRGVATVVTKLWHIVEPTRVYFGQKDIQQAVILRALAVSLLFANPSSLAIDDTFRLIPTRRDGETGLALSSRNAYLSTEVRQKWAPTLFQALSKGREVFEHAASNGQTARFLDQAVSAAEDVVASAAAQATFETQGRVQLRLDYLTISSANTLETLSPLTSASDSRQVPAGAVLSGAMWVEERKEEGKVTRTRLIDNILLGAATSLIRQEGAPASQ